MIYILENDLLKVKISSLGAEIQSVRRLDTNTEYMWQGDPAYWRSRSPLLFPVCGRLVEGKYTYGGQEYALPNHGFARHSEWTVIHQKSTVLTLRLTSSAATLEVYPFRFAFEISYTLTEDTLIVSAIIRNLDDKTMLFALGAHPGFNLPLEKDLSFADYCIEFDAPCKPQLLEMSEDCFYTGRTHTYPLENDRRLSLCHSLFDHDALFFTGMSSGVTLRSTQGERCVHLSYPEMKYLGIWHSPRSQAPFVCIEPWAGMAGMDQPGVVRLEDKPDMTALEPQGIYRNTYALSFR